MKFFNKYKLGWLRFGKFFFMLWILYLIISGMILGVAHVKGESMEPTLKDGQLLLYNRMNKDYYPGKIVAIKMPSGEKFVKRIIAIEGDVIDIKDGNLYINNEIREEEYVRGKTFPDSQIYPFTVDENCYFVLGDNREGSVDSRTFGQISEEQIKGIVLGK